MKISHLLLSFLFLFACSQSQTDVPAIYNKEVKVPPTKSFYKPMAFSEQTSLEITSSALEGKRFDFNIFDYASYKDYEKTKDLSQLIFVCKSQDLEKLDTTIPLNPGKYMFAWENYENPETVTLNVQMKPNKFVNFH